MDGDRRAIVFLSHWGEDADQADWLAVALQARLRRAMTTPVDVFNTSRPEYRFDDPDLLPGDDWRKVYEAYVHDLRAYLEEHLAHASASLLLLTPTSARRDSAWVRWEIQESARMAKQREILFVPCLLGVGYEALNLDPGRGRSDWQQREVGDLEPEPPRASEFQALRLDGADRLERLADVLVSSLRRNEG
jgi:hypothetical protein